MGLYQGLYQQKVVVCGGGGFIGGHLIKQLLQEGVNVTRSVDVKPRNEWYQVHPGVENVTADLKQLTPAIVPSRVPMSSSTWPRTWAAWALSKTTKPFACSVS